MPMEVVDFIWLAVTQLGEERFYIVILSLIYLFYERRLGARVSTVVLLNMCINAIAKDFFKMPRPPTELWKVAVEGYGFPSGHAQGSVVLWGYLSYNFSNLPLGLMSIATVLLVSYSRIALSVHYPLDIIGGWVTGLAVLSLSIVIQRSDLSSRLGRWNRIIWLTVPVVLFLLSFWSGLGLQANAITNGILIGVLSGYFLAERRNLREPGNRIKRGIFAVGSIALIGVLYFVVIRPITDTALLLLCSISLGFIAAFVIPFIEDRSV